MTSAVAPASCSTRSAAGAGWSCTSSPGRRAESAPRRRRGSAGTRPPGAGGSPRAAACRIARHGVQVDAVPGEVAGVVYAHAPCRGRLRPRFDAALVEAIEPREGCALRRVPCGVSVQRPWWLRCNMTKASTVRRARGDSARFPCYAGISGSSPARRRILRAAHASSRGPVARDVPARAVRCRCLSTVNTPITRRTRASDPRGGPFLV